MNVRFAVGLVASALSIGSISAPARCDLKIETVTRLDCSHLLIDGARMSAQQLSVLRSLPQFSSSGVCTTIWVKGDIWRMDKPGETTIVDSKADTVTVVDLENHIYYTTSRGSGAGQAAYSYACRFSRKPSATAAFGFRAERADTVTSWLHGSEKCSAMWTQELAPLPADIPLAVPAVGSVLGQIQGLPLSLRGTVTMRGSVGTLGFDWHVTSVSTATFDPTQLLPPAGFKRVDAPSTSLDVRVPMEFPVSRVLQVSAE